jgi:hypothetical protein
MIYPLQGGDRMSLPRESTTPRRRFKVSLKQQLFTLMGNRLPASLILVNDFELGPIQDMAHPMDCLRQNPNHESKDLIR